MPQADATVPTAQTTVSDRAERLFLQAHDAVIRRTDRLFAGLMLFQWAAALVAALVISPRAWSGTASATHIHVWAAVLLGGLIVALPVALVAWLPGKAVTRHVIAVGQMLTSALLIHLLGGRIETHFHVFGSLAFLAFYRDWRVLVSATVVVALDHMLRGVFWPQSVYGVAGAAEWRWLEHAGWVAFEDAFLVLSCAQGIREMKGIALRQAQLESTNAILEETTRRAEAAAEAKGQFLANMSHEIRTPLNGVIGTTELLMHTPLGPKQAKYAGLIRSSAGTLLGLVNDILDFSKIEAGKFEISELDFDPRTLVEEVTEVLAPRAAEKGLELLCRISPDVPKWSRGDPARVRQVLLNLGSNAIKFTERGEVVVAAECPSGPAGPVRFSVTDTGVGIPKDRIDRLFKKFSQVDESNTRRHGGTGLGLAISKELTELMGGRIGVESTSGRGSTFWADIPLAPPATAPRQASAAAHRLRGIRVLVVDDNATNREILIEQCGGWGFQATVADSAAAALALVSDRAAPPFDVLLVDMQMPGMNGAALARRLREDARYASAPLIVLSSIDDFGEAEADSGLFSARLVKPVRQSDLLDTIVRLVAPAPQAAAERPVAPPAPAALPGPRRRAVLAEDNKVNQVVALDMLADMGVDCVVATDGQRAVELVREGEIDLVLMDCQMPVMDGFEATKEIRRLESAGPAGPGNPARLPIIALTANALKGDRERCLRAGMDGYVSKPIEWDALERAINEATIAGITGHASEPRPDAIGLRDLLRRCRGKTDTAAAVLDVLLEDLPTRLAELRRAADARDGEGIRRVAHALKGAAANGSAPDLRRLAANIEGHAAAAQWAKLEDGLRDIEAEITRCRECVRRMRDAGELGGTRERANARPGRG